LYQGLEVCSMNKEMNHSLRRQLLLSSNTLEQRYNCIASHFPGNALVPQTDSSRFSQTLSPPLVSLHELPLLFPQPLNTYAPYTLEQGLRQNNYEI